MSKSNLIIPSQKELESRFSFINNKVLRVNIVIAFRYIIFLINIESDLKLPGAILYSLYKDIILYTATIVESCIHYCLKEYIDSGQLKSTDIMPYEWKDSVCKDLYLISEDEKVCGVIRHKVSEHFTDKTQFKTLNEACLKANLFDKSLFDKAENLRNIRNNIHLVALKRTDDYYEKKDTQEAFEIAKTIIERVENKLMKLQKI
ncbi:hypothetical protein HYT02_02875 [Candidatus Gottesmanbacteria bacterium]|nr:hypothetical protein [Candidatus Gottesmanbacteria bacterium]